jgi:hypothetical protein
MITFCYKNLIFYVYFCLSCLIIKLFCKKMPVKWVLLNQYSFMKSIMFILVSVSGEVSK